MGTERRCDGVQFSISDWKYCRSVLQANDTDWFSMTGKTNKVGNRKMRFSFFPIVIFVFSLSALKLLRELVRHTGAKIVLSSTWRLLASTRQVSDVNHLYLSLSDTRWDN